MSNKRAAERDQEEETSPQGCVGRFSNGSHPDIVVNVDPERMLRGLDLTKILMTEAAVIFANDEDTLHYFVSGA